MYLLEHDAKQLLALHGITLPAGILVEDAAKMPVLPPGPWVVKAQLAAGGRGKAGGIRKTTTETETLAAAAEILCKRIRGLPVRGCRIEQQVSGAVETYLSLMIDAAQAAVRVMLAARGGADIETLSAQPGLIRSALCDPEPSAVSACVRNLGNDLAEPLRGALAAAGSALSVPFFAHECVLLEINPLFVKPDGTWSAGDAKMITDDNALERQPALRELLQARAGSYPEVALKLRHGCDYVVVDPDGEIGLLTTGAGLSMMLIDELRAAGLKPYNFLDVRTGGLRGDPTRLVHVLNWIAQGPRIKVILVNVFAGITDLGEFARLLLAALAQAPQLKVPVVARLVGNGIEAAQQALGAARIPVVTELDAAVARVRECLHGEPRP
ncbi:MAG: ATP-grasp domain-containing protein [Pseudomonadota bacterium]